MEKEALISKMKPLLGSTDNKGFYPNGITERTLIEYASRISASIADDAADDVFTSHKSILDAIGGQLRYELGEYKKSVQTPPKPEPEPTPPANDVMAQLLQKITGMEEANKQLKERLDKADEGVRQNTYKDSVIKLLKENNANNDYVLETTLNGYTVDVTKSEEDAAKSLLEAYDKNYTRCFGNGEAPRIPDASGSSKNTKELDDYFSEKASEGKMPTPNTQT